MKLQKVIFQVDGEEVNISCYQITAESGELGFFFNDKLFTSLLPIMEQQLKRANSIVTYYKRDCRGRRYASAAASFWEQMLERGVTLLKD